MLGLMDPLTHLLQGIRTRQSVLHRSILEPPWALRIEERAELTLAAVLKGHCWAVFDDGEAARLDPGQIAIITTTEPYLVADDPLSPIDVVVRRDGVFDPMGTRLDVDSSAMTCTMDEDGSTVVISGNYLVRGDLSGRLVEALPRLAKVELPHSSTLLALLIEELASASPGQQAALDRWLDLALVTALRVWFDRSESRPGWYAALSDDVIGPALAAVHEDPAYGWTIEILARRGAASRTAFVRRFTTLVGEPPMTYVTRLRLDLAAELLRSTDDPLSAIATRVGYATPFGLSAAFKRHVGQSPAQFRRQPLAG